MAASRPDRLVPVGGTVVLLRELIKRDLPALFKAIGRPEWMDRQCSPCIGSGVNTDPKRLPLDAALAHGIERVRLKADVLNIRSRAAIERVGA